VGSTPDDITKFCITNKPITGCHVVALDWATWHLYIQPMNATCQPLIRPRQLPYCQVNLATSSLPRQMLTSSVPRVTLLMVTRVTPALVHPYAKPTCHALPRVVTRGFHVSSAGDAMSPVWTIRSGHSA
jgi:hypothetical protein